MSTGTKRHYAAALADAEAFRALFEGCYELWEFAGSLRRRRTEVGDVEHVVIPKWIDASTMDLFGTISVPVNLLLAQSDRLLSSGQIGQHLYGKNESFRWGDKMRGCEFRGLAHEIYSATIDNWGSTLAIRTGPADLSQELVIGLRKQGRRNLDGQVWRCTRCSSARCEDSCEHCQGTNLRPVMVIPVRTEQDYFRNAGMAWISPEKR